MLRRPSGGRQPRRPRVVSGTMRPIAATSPAWHEATDGRPRGTHRRDRGLRAVRRPDGRRSSKASSTPSRRPSSPTASGSSARASAAPASTSSSMARRRSSSTARSGPASAAATSSARCRSCSARRRSPTSSPPRPLRCLVLAGPRGRGVPRRPPAGHVPDAPGPGPPAAGREPMAELTAARSRPATTGRRHRQRARRAPGLVLAAAARRAATRSSRPIRSPGGMFRRWPFFQRLLSWTKPHAPAARGTRAYERYDWNSLLGEEPETRALAARA